MEKKPLISIIVPVYNVEKYLRCCIDSICRQENINKEIILVNDGSTDSSGAICDEYAIKYPDIVVIHKENGGLASARNAGLDAMNGSYVGFIDSDDYIAKDMYTALLMAMQETNSKVTCCGWDRVTEYDTQALVKETKESISRKVYTKEEAMRSLFLNEGMTYSACDKLFEANLFEENRFPSGNMPSEDIPCIYQILKNAGRIVHIGMNKYYYRVVTNSISQKQFTSKNMSTVLYMQQIYEDIIIEDITLREEAFFALVQCIGSVYARLMRDGKNKECKREKQQMEAFLRKNSLKVVRSKYLTRNAKIVSLSIMIKCYPIFIKLLGKVKHEK